MVALLFHAGGWDELLVAIAAIGVLWVAVKLAGRKSNDSDDEDDEAETEREEEQEENPEVARPPARPLA